MGPVPSLDIVQFLLTLLSLGGGCDTPPSKRIPKLWPILPYDHVLLINDFLTNVHHGHFKKKLKLIGASVNFWQASEWRKPWFFLCKIFKLQFFVADTQNQIGSKIHIFYTLGLKLYMVPPSICVHRLVYSNPNISTKKGDIQGGVYHTPPQASM